MPFNGSVCAILQKTLPLTGDYLDVLECCFDCRIIVTMMKFEVIRGSTGRPSAPPSNLLSLAISQTFVYILRNECVSPNNSYGGLIGHIKT